MADPATDRGPIVASEAERPRILDVGRLLETGGEDIPVLLGPDGDRVVLPASLRRVLHQAVEVLAQDRAVAVVPVQQVLTTNEAGDVPAYQRPRDATRREALRELTRMNQEFGLYERH